MNVSQVHEAYKTTVRLLLKGRLKKAFDELQPLIACLQNGSYSDRYELLQQNYRYLLQYYVDGVEDPQRKSIYNALVAKLFVLLSELREEILTGNSSNYEYTTKRYFTYENKKTLTELRDALRNFHLRSRLLTETPHADTEELRRLRLSYESECSFLFSFFWLKTGLTPDEKDFVQDLLSEADKDRLESKLLVSALSLNLWRMFDEEKIFILFEAARSSNQQIAQRALLGLCFVLLKYNAWLPYFPALRDRLMLLVDDALLAESLQNIIIQIIGTTETEKISKRMQDEIIPEIAKMSRLAKDNMDLQKLSLISEDGEEENPQWQEMLDRSGIGEKLQELTDLQLEGADIYMSTFSMLKNYPFFSETSNWFLPFDPAHSQVSALFASSEKSLISTFMDSTAICNSDKYSFCLSILQMPETQRNILKSSFQAEAEQMEELSKDEALLKPDRLRKNISKQYIQDLYRFFNLHKHRADFSNMFGNSLLLHRSYLFSLLAAGSDVKENTAAYYFSKKLYPQALELFYQLSEENNSDAALYQKIGYACQKLSQFDKALEAYLKADLIQPDDLWTLRKIALCYRLSGQWEKALKYYAHADFLKPGQEVLRMNMARCHVELGAYKEALSLYHALEDSIRPELRMNLWRSIVASSLLAGDLSQAEYYVDKLLEAQPELSDFFWAGHVACCRRRFADALAYYQKAWKLRDENWELFLEQLEADALYLSSNGIDASEQALLMDEMLYSWK